MTPDAARSGGPMPTWPSDVVGRAWRRNRALCLVGPLMLAMLAVAAVGVVVDDRVITGAPAWVKPAKFAISIALYCLTLLWLLGFVEGRRRWVAVVGTLSAVALVVEMVLIAGQVVRGTTSHFNVSTPLDSAVWTTMGLAIALVWVMNLVAAVLLLRQPLGDPAFAWGLRLGVLVSSVGMAVAFLMTSQETAAQAAGLTPTFGAHSVGREDGGPGLPFVGWSTVAGDLRVPHFVGLHALQILPLLGWLFSRPAVAPLGASRRVALVLLAGAANLGLVLVLTAQALRGQSLVAPGAPTLSALAVVLGGTGVAAAGVVLTRPRSTRRS